MTSVERRDLDTGSAWVWVTHTGLDGVVKIRHQVQYVAESERWLRWEKIDNGGWVSRPAPELPIPADLDEAQEIVRALVIAEKRGT